MSGGCYRIMTIQEMDQMSPGQPSAQTKRDVAEAAQRAVNSPSGRSNQAKDNRRASMEERMTAVSTLAEMGLVGAAQKMLRSVAYDYKSTGDLGEEIAQSVLEDALDLKVTAFAKQGDGYDLVMKTANEALVLVEVKTTDRKGGFGSKLNPDTRGARQASDAWLTAVAQEMLTQDAANRAIAETILSDPGGVTVVGVHVDPATGLADVYVRNDAHARDWTPVMRGYDFR